MIYYDRKNENLGTNKNCYHLSDYNYEIGTTTPEISNLYFKKNKYLFQNQYKVENNHLNLFVSFYRY